jgi:hypothetical protein
LSLFTSYERFGYFMVSPQTGFNCLWQLVQPARNLLLSLKAKHSLLRKPLVIMV